MFHLIRIIIVYAILMSALVLSIKHINVDLTAIPPALLIDNLIGCVAILLCMLKLSENRVILGACAVKIVMTYACQNCNFWLKTFTFGCSITLIAYIAQ
jgi:hypothetical protein